MPHAEINGFSMHHQLHGDRGEPIVFVHGYAGDVGDWIDQVAEFSNTHRVLVLDHRGHGASEGPADRASYTITRMADDVEALAASVGFDRYHLVGHSMGGAISQEIALRSPERLLSLTLFGCGPDFSLRENKAVAQFMASRFKLAEEQGMPAIAALPQALPDPPHMPAGRRDYENARTARMSVHGYIGAWGAMMAWDGTVARIKEIAVPTLIISGELDIAVRGSKHMASQIVGSTLAIIAEAAHCPQFERPQIFNELLRKHLVAHAGLSAVAKIDSARVE